MPIVWRPLLRELFSYLLVAAFVAAMGVFVWWTRHPESASLTEVRSWPLVGPAAGRLQDRYLVPERVLPERLVPETPPGIEPDPAAEAGSVSTNGYLQPQDFVLDVVYEPRPPRPYVWVGEGTPLRSAPDLEARSLGVIDAMTNLFVEERRGDWVRVRHHGSDAWLLKLRPRSTEDHGGRPAPVLPLSPRSADPAVLERAGTAMSGEARDFRLGVYAGRSDFDVAHIVIVCEPLIAALEDRYRHELGLEPVGEVAEVLLIFAAKSDYETFAGERNFALGHSGPGYAATHAEGRDAGSVCSTLVHEAAHLLNRRAIGPALPPWLGEGIAEYMQWSAADGQPRPRAWQPSGYDLPGLEVLIELGDEGFRSRDLATEVYAASGLWIAYLMDEPQLRSGFRRFLAYLASGGPWGEEPAAAGVGETARLSTGLGDDLLHFLGRDYRRLEAGFRAWLWSLE